LRPTNLSTYPNDCRRKGWDYKNLNPPTHP
jgi:hypothetical protein